MFFEFHLPFHQIWESNNWFCSAVNITLHKQLIPIPLFSQTRKTFCVIYTQTWLFPVFSQHICVRVSRCISYGLAGTLVSYHHFVATPSKGSWFVGVPCIDLIRFVPSCKGWHTLSSILFRGLSVSIMLATMVSFKFPLETLFV